jgi:hypothetical protein
MKVLRSIAAVVVSYAVVYLFVVLSDPILTRLFPGQYVPGKVPPTFLLWISTGIFAIASILGGWLCVRMAPSRPNIHLLVLFVLGEAAGAVSAIMIWGKWPHWYSIAWLIAWPICLWIGALFKPTPRGSMNPVSAS